MKKMKKKRFRSKKKTKTTKKVPKKGHHTNKECLKYAHENGCPWNEETCHYAAKKGHLKQRVFEMCARKRVYFGLLG